MTAKDDNRSADGPDPGLIQLTDPAHDLTATFASKVGMIGVSLRHHGEELLGQRRGLEAYRTSGKTMGLPLLYPWANRLGAMTYDACGRHVDLDAEADGLRFDPNGLPIHGVLAASPSWTISDIDDLGGDDTVGDAPRRTLDATFDFGGHPALLASFPFPHRVDLSIRLADGRLTLRTTITPTGDVPVPRAFGFHPYLTLPGTPREAWRVELPTMRHRPVDDRGLPTGAATDQPADTFNLGDRTYDDGYDHLPPGATFAVSDADRRIEVRFDDGYPAGQVFAPPGESLICFEPMAAPTNALVTGDGLRAVRPGDVAAATFSIAVS